MGPGTNTSTETQQATETTVANDPTGYEKEFPFDPDEEATDANENSDLTREGETSKDDESGKSNESNESSKSSESTEEKQTGEESSSSAEGGAETEVTPATEIEVAEFPITIQFGDKSVTFNDEDSYNTFVENATNQSKAWAAIHDRNRKDRAEAIAEQQRVAALERELAELRTQREKSTAPAKPTPPDLTLLDPESPNYNPKVGLAAQAKYNADMLLYLEGKTSAPTLAPTVDPNETPQAREKREIDETEQKWLTDHASDLSNEQLLTLDETVKRLAKERIANLAKSGKSLRPEFDVPDLYDRAFKEVTGKEAVRKQADPKESVKTVSRVIRIATERAKAAPKQTKAAPPVEESIPDDPTNDDSISPARHRELLRAGKIKDPLGA